MSNTLVITDEETKTTWRMPRELLKDLKRYALENDTNVTAVVLRACREFLAKDKMFKDKYKLHSGPKEITSSKEVEFNIITSK